MEEALRDKEHHTAFGRKAYPSALHCIIDAAVNYTEEVSRRKKNKTKNKKTSFDQYRSQVKSKTTSRIRLHQFQYY